MVANLVAEAIVAGDSQRQFYDLRAWVVMPNHVHLLILPKVKVPVLMRWLKGSTARSANRVLGRTGHPFWQDESYDHYLRSGTPINRTIAYIERNPVSAGLVRAPELWPCSSAVGPSSDSRSNLLNPGKQRQVLDGATAVRLLRGLASRKWQVLERLRRQPALEVTR